MSTPDLVIQAQSLLDSLWDIHRRMTGPEDTSPEGPYNDYYLERVEDMIGRAIRRLERRARKPISASHDHARLNPWRAGGRVTHSPARWTTQHRAGAK